MVGFEERVYELAAAALAAQERQVSELRGRASTLIAAATVVASLLARPVFDGGHPESAVEVAATVLGLCGATGMLPFAVLLLRPYQIGFSVQAAPTYRALWEQDITEQPLVDLALGAALEERRAENAAVVGAPDRYLGFGLAALVLETVGLATAAGLAL